MYLTLLSDVAVFYMYSCSSPLLYYYSYVFRILFLLSVFGFILNGCFLIYMPTIVGARVANCKVR